MFYYFLNFKHNSSPETNILNLLFILIKSQVQEKAKAKFDVYIPVDFISTNEHGVNYTYVVKVVGFLCLMLILFCFYLMSQVICIFTVWLCYEAQVTV